MNRSSPPPKNPLGYTSRESFRHDDPSVVGSFPAVGVVVANLGTPEGPDARSLRPYLRQFLSDPRVIELPRALWFTILNLFILTTRPKRSAEAYARVWTEEGSPLLTITEAQARGLAERLAARVGSPVHVAAAMTYGEPSVPRALRELREKGCQRILVLPMYPQYSGTTTASVFDAVVRELTTWRWVPELRTVGGWHDRAGYVEALAASIREVWERDGRTPERLVFSFHGIPRRYFENGDPYHCLCHKTARLVAEHLELPPESWQVCFQSLFGKEEWLKPYTDVTLEAMARSGVRSVDVVCPGFAADCLETLDEIDYENREGFLEAGGESFRYIPALNDRPDHLELLTQLALENLGGWIAPPETWSPETAAEEARSTARRAEALAADPPRADAGYGA